VFLLFLFVFWKRRDCNAKSESGNFYFKKRRHYYRHPKKSYTVATFDVRVR